MKTIFLAVVEPKESGSAGLLECVTKILKDMAIPASKLAGITTDGEAANTERNAGLWKLHRDYLGRDIVTVWCTCHRTDLAVESIEASVPELVLWKANLKSVATFFRLSKRRTKLLEKYANEDATSSARSFPCFLEVRFAEHLRQLIGSCLENLNWTRKV